MRVLSTVWLAALLAAAMALIACGDGGEGDATVRFNPDDPTEAVPTATLPEGMETPVESPADTPTPLPQYGEVLPCGETLVPLNKEQRLPEDCVPPDLVPVPQEFAYGNGHEVRAETAEAAEEMLSAALAEGHELYVISAYRSYQTQAVTFQNHVDMLGEAEAERVSARPGHSEHQLGTTIDVTSESVGFELVEALGDTPEGRWLEENSWRYGFIISYPRGAEEITGYSYEPWHLRYVGRDIAREVHESGLTLHEFLTR